MYGPKVSIPSPQDSHLPFHFRSQQMSTHLLSSSLDGAWANRTTNGWLQLWGADTQQFATHCQGKKHKASIAPPLKAKRQLPMTQFFSAAAALAPPANDDAPPLGEIEGEDGVATSTGADGSALALGANWKCTGVLPLCVPNANALCGQYPVMRHAHKKVHWRYVDGMRTVSVNPPCSGVAPVSEPGEKLPCAEVAQVAAAAAAVQSALQVAVPAPATVAAVAAKTEPKRRHQQRRAPSEQQLPRAVTATATARPQPKSSQLAASARSGQPLPKVGRALCVLLDPLHDRVPISIM